MPLAVSRPKFRNLFFAGVIQAHGHLPCICIVRELKPNGATLMATKALPLRFLLSVEANGFEAECQVVDKQDHRIEVVFV